MTPLARLKRDLRALRNELRRDPRVKFLDVRLVGLSGGTLELQTLVVKADQRGGGAGAMVMDALTRFADAHGLRMILTPSDVYGGDEGRLRAFYGRWGFVPQGEVRMGRDPVRRENPPRGGDRRMRELERLAAMDDGPASLELAGMLWRSGRAIQPSEVRDFGHGMLRARFFWREPAYDHPFLDVYLQANQGILIDKRHGPRARKGSRTISREKDLPDDLRFVVLGNTWSLSAGGATWRGGESAEVRISTLNGLYWPPPEWWWALPQVQSAARAWASFHKVQTNPPRGADERLRRAEQRWLTTQDRADRDAWARELARVGQTWPDDVVMPPDREIRAHHVSWRDVPPMGREVSLFLGPERHEGPPLARRLRTPLIGLVSFQGAHDAGWISGVDQDADLQTIARRNSGDWWASPQAQRLLRQLAMAQAEP